MVTRKRGKLMMLPRLHHCTYSLSGCRLFILLFLFTTGVSFSVQAELAKPTDVSAADSTEFRKMEEKHWDTWARLSWGEIENYYSKDPNAIYFVLLAPKLVGQDEYLRREKIALSDISAAKMTISDDFTLIKRGKLAIAAYSWHTTFSNKDGSSSEMNGFLTDVWTTENGRWVITHEHMSLEGRGPGGEQEDDSGKEFSDTKEIIAEKQDWVRQGVTSPTTDEIATFRGLEEELWMAWGERGDPRDIAHMFSKDPDHIFFDLGTPAFGWDNYEAISLEATKDLATANVTIKDDFTVMKNDDLAVTIYSTNTAFTNKTGPTRYIPIRTTDVWVKEDDKWVIVHQHLSVR
jgi:ketosteroid isomerase-like protein